MKGIAEYDMRADVADFIRRHGLDRAVGAYRHKGWGLYGAVGEGEHASARGAVLVRNGKIHMD